MEIKFKINKLFFLCIIFSFSNAWAQSNLEYLNKIKKIDLHTHISDDAPYLRKLMDSMNMKFVTLCTGGKTPLEVSLKTEKAKEFSNKYPRYYGWVTTFDAFSINERGWEERTIKKLKSDFDNGAVGVKIWKSIGMEIRNNKGELIQVDDPALTPIFDFIAEQGKTLIAHIGEPIQAWMPTRPATEERPGSYWEKHPDFSWWERPDMPSYSDIMAARDRVIARHPNLRFVGAHLGSLEFDVDEIAKRLEKYPNFAVEVGGRTRYFMWQARGKVKEFFEMYQDRIMYGSDRKGGMMVKGEKATPEQMLDSKNAIVARHKQFFQYFATSDEIPWGNYVIGEDALPEPTYTVKGLYLSKEILDKFFYKNALKWFPGLERGY